MASRLGQIISGRYLIKELIGEGGMGAVYLAEHTHMRKRVALKLLHAEMNDNEEVLARFRREAEAAARIEHPNVVAATDFGRIEDGSFFLVLEYVEGTSLRDAISKGPLPVARALHITRQIAFALERAHDAGIVHRDLKPENVMLVKKEEDPDFVKVLDFGIARIETAQRDGGQQPLTRMGTILGTPEYMAPEQALGETVTPVADLYAVGVMLYEMLTGRHPFDADDRMAILSMHLVAPVPPMADRAPNVQVPPPVEALVRRLLEKEAKARYPSGRALVDAIEEAAGVSGVALPASLSPTPMSSRQSNPNLALPPSSSRMLAGPQSTRNPDAQWQANDAFAKTSFGIDGPSPTAPTAYGGQALVPIPPQLAFLKKLPRGALLGIIVGVPILILILVVTLILARRSSDPNEAENGDNEPGIASTVAKPKRASAEKLKAAADQGTTALEALAKEFPEDPAIPKELVRVYNEGGQTSEALKWVRTLAERDAKAIDEGIAQLVIGAAAKADTQDEAFSLLEGPLGARGVDGLLELATSKNVSPNTRLRASKALLRPDVKANASPAASVLLDLRTAKNCEARRELLERAKEHGDARILPMLKQLKNARGCGFMGVRDCYPCLRKDDSLEEAITAVEGRGGAAPK